MPNRLPSPQTLETTGSTLRVCLKTVELGQKNKQFFDQLYREKDNIERELNMTLLWERLDSARLSRVGIYREGTTDSAEAELDELQTSAVSTLIKFRSVFGKRIRAL